ncbi:MAG: hypothetical protein MJ246_06520, partial [Clostridia bacterium]|nr:hypothetical protein [Clostridia bacterium]
MRVTSNNNDGVYTINQDIDIIVEFNEEINVALDGEPRLALQLDDEVVYAKYVNNGSRTDMTFRYSIKKGDKVAKLEYTGEDALELRGATVRDNKGNVSSLLLPLTTSENSLGGNKNIRVETEDPYAIVTEYQKTKELKEYTITFNRKVTGFDMDDILVYDGQKANFRVIEENRIFKLDVTRSTANNQTIVIPANCCNDVENGIPNTAGVPIPKGFHYFGGDKESGIVMTDSSKDQNSDFYDFGAISEFADTSTYGNNFIWVPVDYINDATGSYLSSNSKKEVVTGQRFGKRDFGIYGYGTYESYDETLPQAVVSSIEKYQGFYVARYEGVYGTDGKMGSKLSVKNALGYVGRQKANDKDSKLVVYNYVSASTAGTAINKL